MKALNFFNRNREGCLTYGLVVIFYIIMQTLASQGALSRSVSGYLVPICVYIVLAVSLNLVVGISGELSLGHAGFMGVGAFAGIVAAAVLKDMIGNDFLRLLAALFCGGCFAGLAGLLVGIPVLRLQGDYLAIVTLAFGEILKNIIGNLYIGQVVALKPENGNANQETCETSKAAAHKEGCQQSYKVAADGIL